MNKTTYLLFFLFFILYSWGYKQPKINQEIKTEYKNNTRRTYPLCLQMYFYIEKYADSFNIPKKYAYGVAKLETGYKGPFHWNYNPYQSSNVAHGPMQIQLKTARYLNKDNVSLKKLKYDIEYNIYTSLKYLNILYGRYQDWGKVLGYYNTGYPIINSYAEKIML